MEILIMQVFVSLLLVLGSVLLFLFTVRQRDFDHADRLALMPVDTDDELEGNDHDDDACVR
jgi:cbb3-type cytochrome oxidase maturation protein